MWILPSRRGNARMRIFNPDGSEASMCGNGLRCVAWYLYMKDHGRTTHVIETGAGLITTEVVKKERTRIYLTPPKEFRLGLKLTVLGKRLDWHAVNTGVPHAVLFSSRIDKLDLGKLGPAVRFHKIFKPAGANVNLVQIQTPHRIAVRTYERGVEGETMACGTGSVACVVIGASLGKLKPPVSVLTAGGERLSVGFRQERKLWEGLYLEGPARILFEGVIRQ